MAFCNTYEDARRAAAYDELALGGTYHLAFRDLSALLRAHVTGPRALDFGCGTGRSTRLLQTLGFRTVGVDISREMVAIARARDPRGEYRVVDDGDLSTLDGAGFDLVLCAFTFDNVAGGREHRLRLLEGLRRSLGAHGRIVNIVSTPEIYHHEWVTFTTRAFPENAAARCGEVVRIVTTDYSDGRPVEDILWPDEDYRTLYRDAGLAVVQMERPLATGDEGIAWRSETTVAPWSIYVLRSE